jgi:uncharacterized delta-60 repeat protein
MKMFRWLAAGVLVILLAALVLSRTGRVQPVQSPQPSSAVSPAGREVAASAVSTATVGSVVTSITPIPVTAPHSSINVFENWARAFVQGDGAQRAALLEKVGELAAARRAEMAALIRANPQEALHRSLPYSLRQQLPAHVLLQIEQPVSARGLFRSVCYKPFHAAEDEAHDLGYEVIINGTRYETYTYGARLQQPAHDSVYLHGVSVMDDAKDRELLALSDDVARVITDEQEKQFIAEQGRMQGDTGCDLSRRTIVQFGDQFYSYCDQSQAEQLNQMLQAAHGMIWGSGAKSHATENLPIEGFSGTQGIKKLLYIRVLFADDPVPPQSDNGAQATAQANNRYFYEGSYGTVWWESTITPLVRLPQRKNFYGENPGALLGDAAAGAALLGYFTSDYYSPHYVLHNTLVQYDFGGLSSGILNASPGALTHELGHNFGLPHADLWRAHGSQPGPVQPQNLPPWPIDPDSLIGHYDVNAPAILGRGDQPSYEYGNHHDVMGSGGGHFSAMFKNAMEWLPDPFIKRINGSTTNRIYAFDTPRIDQGRLYAMRMRKDASREYWFTYRQGFPNNPWFSNGLEVDWNIAPANPGFSVSLGNNVLLDTTPESTFAKEDAALVVGRTFHDPQASMHVTPIAIGGGPDASDKWIDVVVQIGSFPGNQVPTLSIESSAVNVPVGTTVNFTASAQDADGDALAYYWDFGDWTFGANAPLQSKQFSATGQFVVRCEVSDMKGGVISRHILVTVGSPATYTISGRVLDTEGNPVQGVRVHNSGTKPDTASPYEGPPLSVIGSTDLFPASVGTYRYGFTDIDGYYIIGNNVPDDYVLRAFKFGYSTVPLSFTDPVDVRNGNANEINFTATKIARVRVAQTLDAFELGGEGNDGIFTITREGGDFTQDLPVRFSVSGSAFYLRDYTLTAVDTLATNCTITTNDGVRITNCVTSTNAIGQAVIPAFQSSIDVHVVPIDNAVGDGDKAVVMTLSLQTNFFRIRTEVTNFFITNGTAITTNSVITNRIDRFRVPGWELRPSGVSSTPTWFQTDPTYVMDQAEATVLIQDDDAPAIPSVLVGSLDTDALESRGDMAMLIFLRQGAPLDEELVVHYALSGEAVNGEDYVELPGVITIPAGQAFALLPITAVNDLFVEGNETLSVTVLPSPEDAYTLSIFGGSGFAIIVDDDLPLVNIFSAISTVPRNGGAARVTVSRAGSTDEALTVNYLVTGTAESGVDFNTLAGSVVIPAGQLSANIDVSPIASSPNPLPRTVTIQLSDATTYNIYQQNSATITIFDNNLPTVTLARTAASVNENGGTAAFVVTRTGTTNASLNVFFDVGGSAWEGSDYASIGTNIVIPAGSLTASINITGLNDPAREVPDVTGQDTIIVRLRTHSTYNLGGTVNQTMTITDDEGDSALPSVGFMLASSTVPEDAGVAMLYLKVTANPATNRPIQLEYRVTSATAVPNVNYVNLFPTGPDTLTTTGILNITHYFPPDPPPQFFNFENGIYGIPVQILDDGVAAGDKTLTITLFNPTRFTTNTSLATNTAVMPPQVFTNFLITRIPTNAFLGPALSHTLTIQDLRTSAVTVTALEQRAYESGPAPARFVFSRTGSTNVPLTVAFSLEGTAAIGSDYSLIGVGPTNGTVTIPAGTNAVIVTLMPINDPTEEVAESVTLTLLERPGYHVSFGSSSTVIIVSDDGTIQFLSESYRVSEDGGNAVITVTRTGGTNLTTTVDYLFTGGSAINGVDYFGTNGILTFPPGETLRFITVPLVDDTLVESDETVTLVLSNATGGVPLGGQNTATLFIVNDDTAFEFATSSFRGNENGTFGSVDIRRFGVLTNTDTVTFTATNGTADASDFIASSFPVTFLPGETNQTVTVSITDDVLFEGDETVSLALSTPSTDTTLGALSNATLVIVDDECQIEFEVAGYSIIEYSNFVTLVIRRVGGTVNSLSVNYATSDGTATNGMDYGAVNATVNFTGDGFALDTNGSGAVSFVPGQSTRIVTVPITDDVLGEGSETFTVTLSDLQTLNPAAQPGATLLGTNVTATVTILDNELPGNVDYEFNPGAGANATVRSVAQSPRGGLVEFLDRVVIGGDFTTVDNFVFNHVARLLPDGSLDASFNPGAGADGNVLAVAVQPDGRVLVGGEFTTMNNTNRVRLARLNGDGKLDLSFDPGIDGVNAAVRAIVIQPDGRVLIGGDFSQVGGAARGFVARLQTNGVLDSNFTATVNGNVHALALQSDGKILIGGAFSLVSGASRLSLARLNANGTLDTSFEVGTGFNGPVHAVAVLADGRVLAGGSFSNYNAVNIKNLVRLGATGLLDNSFKSGTGPDGSVLSIAPAAAGRVVIGGEFLNYNAVPRAGFARLTPNGGLDRGFDIGTGANAPVRAVVAQENTAIIIGGDFTLVNGLPRNRVARIHGDEFLDLVGVEYSLSEFSVSEAGGATIRITVQRTGGTNRAFNVDYYTADGTATAPDDYLSAAGVLSFGAGELTKTFDVEVFDDLLVEGNETVRLFLTNASALVELGDLSRSTLVILDSARSVYFAASQYTVDEAGTNAAITLIRAGSLEGDVTITLSTSNLTAAAGYDYAGFTNLITFTNGESLKTVLLPLISDDGDPEYTETLLLRLGAPGTVGASIPSSAVLSIEDNDPGPGLPDQRFDPGAGAGRFVRALALQTDKRLLVGGAFTNFANSNLNFIARLDTNGLVDPSFTPGTGPNALVSGIGLSADGHIAIGGAFSNFNGQAFNRVVRLTTNGLPDPFFTQPMAFDSAINGLVSQVDGKILVGGAFKVPASGVARIRVNGTLDLQFDPSTGADGPVNAVALQPDGKVLIGGGFTNVAGFSRPRLARLGTNGILDVTLPAVTITNGNIFALAAAPGGKILIGGSFRYVNGVPRSGIARLNGDGSLDLTFAPGTGATGTVYTVSVLTNGSVFVGGDFTSMNGVPCGRYALLRENGSVDTQFDASVGADNTVFASVITPEQQVIIGGDFTTVGGQTRRGVARLNVAGQQTLRFTQVIVVGDTAMPQINSVPGGAYVLEGSTNLTYWLPLSTNVATGVTLDFNDPSVLSNSLRFYRARRFGP